MAAETVEKIAKQCTFESMKENPATNKRETDSRRRPNTTKFMRKGQVGDWKNFFTEKQNEEFDKQYAGKMKGSGLDFDWE